MAAAFALVIRGLHPFLSVSEPTGAKVLVVEGWMGPHELAASAQMFRAGGYQQVLTTGGPIHTPEFEGTTQPTIAHKAADHLVRRGVPRSVITAVPAPDTDTNRTYESAVSVRKWAERSGQRLQAIDLVSDGPHARRSRMLFEMALPGTKVGVLAIPSHEYDGSAWWRTTAGTKEMLEQTLGFLWVKCCFWPPEERGAQL